MAGRPVCEHATPFIVVCAKKHEREIYNMLKSDLLVLILICMNITSREEKNMTNSMTDAAILT